MHAEQATAAATHRAEQLASVAHTQTVSAYSNAAAAAEERAAAAMQKEVARLKIARLSAKRQSLQAQLQTLNTNLVTSQEALHRVQLRQRQLTATQQATMDAARARHAHAVAAAHSAVPGVSAH